MWVVLRDQSAQRTIGGGRVIDPFAPKRGRSRPTRIATLMSIRKGSTKEVLTSLAERSNTGVPLKEFTVSHNVQPSEIDNLISLLSLRRVGKSTGQRLFSEKKWQITWLISEILTNPDSRRLILSAWNPNQISYVPAVHESGAVLMALGHASATGEVGAVTITHGPALSNAVTALRVKSPEFNIIFRRSKSGSSSASVKIF